MFKINTFHKSILLTKAIKTDKKNSKIKSIWNVSCVDCLCNDFWKLQRMQWYRIIFHSSIFFLIKCIYPSFKLNLNIVFACTPKKHETSRRFLTFPLGSNKFIYINFSSIFRVPKFELGAEVKVIPCTKYTFRENILTF